MQLTLMVMVVLIVGCNVEKIVQLASNQPVIVNKSVLAGFNISMNNYQMKTIQPISQLVNLP